MNGIVELALLMEIGEKLSENGVLEKIEEAKGDSEKLESLALEAEKAVFEVTNNVIKSDEEINKFDEEEAKKGIEGKREIIKGLVEHQYRYAEIPTPFENGLTLDEVIERNAK